MDKYEKFQLRYSTDYQKKHGIYGRLGRGGKKGRAKKKVVKKYTGGLERSNPRAHTFMSRVGVGEDTKAKFLEFFDVNDVRNIFNFENNYFFLDSEEPQFPEIPGERKNATAE
jgi:hypothetical protein